MRFKLSAALAVMCVLSGTVFAASIINVGSHELLENTSGQTIQLHVTGTDEVTAFNLRAQIGDGTGPNAEPVFESISFSGGIWDANANTVTGGPIDGAEQFAQAWVAFNTTVSVPADGPLLTLTIDTTGFFAGESFHLLLKGTEIGADSDFVVIGGGTLAPDITNGTIDIVSEPVVQGDVNGDGNVDTQDISPFVAALLAIDEDAFLLVYEDGEYWAADVNEDGNIDTQDITPFIALLTGGGLAIPEPATLSLLALAAVAMARRERRH